MRSRRVDRPLTRSIAAAVVAMAMLALPSAAHADPVRSGTILGGYTVGLGPMGCIGFPDCAAWLASGCDARLAGREPAVHTSIVDVGDLAGSYRILRRDHPWLANTIEFWSAGCVVIGSVPGNTRDLSIPHDARWMTITASLQPVQDWTLS